MSFDPAKGVFRGIVNANAGVYPLAFNATSVAGTVPQQFTFNLINAGPVFTTPDKVDWIQGASGSFTIAAQMGTQAATLALTAGGLTGTGLSFDPATGVLSGNAQDEPAPTLTAAELDKVTANIVTLKFTQPLASASPSAPAGFEVKAGLPARAAGSVSRR